MCTFLTINNGIRQCNCFQFLVGFTVFNSFKHSVKVVGQSHQFMKA